MIQEKKRKLRNIALLLIFGLIGGTFAFTAFNQQAINAENSKTVLTLADVYMTILMVMKIKMSLSKTLVKNLSL
ncbi:hypothetical protein [Lactococcus petauri]|uniref:hypothetical protein n=1 Tax=Lactococcus petauri TaxID=1940789 RepID=UPI00201830D1|nr:hypothetical protein [Lactococcus petauri]